nr:MAG: coat protein [Chemarfal virus 58]
MQAAIQAERLKSKLYRERSAKKRAYRQLKKVRKYRSYLKGLNAGDTNRRWLVGQNWANATEQQKMARQALRYYGEGDYRDYVKWIPRAIGGMAGGGLAAMQRGDIIGGAQSGWDKGAAFSKWLGWGDYHAGGGSMGSVNQIAGGGPPISVNAAGDMSGDVIMTRTEFVGNVSVSTGAGQTITPFQQTTFQLNPGWSGTFPWLSQIASNFELYDWEGLMFMYRPTSGEFGASAVSNALGKVVMATRYGVTQFNGFSSTVEAQNYDYANSTKPSLQMVHGVETKNTQQVGGDMLVIRDNAIANNPNVVLYDVGRLYVMTEGIPLAASSTAIIGELWVTYRVRLSRAKLWSSIGNETIWNRIRFNASNVSSFLSIAGQASSGEVNVTLTNVSAQVMEVSITPSTYPFTHLNYYVTLSYLGGTTLGTTGFLNITNITNFADIMGTSNTLPTTVPTTQSAAAGNFSIQNNIGIRILNPNLPVSFRIILSATLNAGTIGYVALIGVDQDFYNTL